MPNIDLTTLSGWSSLSTGSHSITIVAKADGYRDSEPSAAVSVTKAGEKYIFNDKLTSLPSDTGWQVTFTCASSEYNYFKRGTIYDPPVNSRNALVYGVTDANFITVYDSRDGWTDAKYRTIVITGGTDIKNTEFLSWLQANATKQ